MLTKAAIVFLSGAILGFVVGCLPSTDELQAEARAALSTVEPLLAARAKSRVIGLRGEIREEGSRC